MGSDPIKAVSTFSGELTHKAQDVATLGNRDLVNNVSGGLLDATKGATQGNSSDIARIGATVGAFGVGGPMAAIGVNQAFAAGASPLQVAMGIASQGGTGMEWLDSIGNILNNPAAQSILGLNKPAPAPAPALQAAPSVAPSVQPPSQGLSMPAMIGIGLGVVAVVLGLFFVLKKK